MTWEEVIELIQDLLVIAALVGAVWSAWNYWLRVREDREFARQQKLIKWRKVSVHKILNGSANFLPVSEILDKLKSSSFDEEFPIKKHELTERELRVILLEGIESGYFQQLWGDTYGVARRDPVSEQAYNALSLQELLIEAYDLISFAKGPLSTAEILEKLNRNHVRDAEFEIAMRELTSRGLVGRNEVGNWYKRDV